MSTTRNRLKSFPFMSRRQSRWDYLVWFIRYRLLRPDVVMKNLWWWFRYRTFNRYNKVELRALPPGYHDIDIRMLHANFQLLVDYVKNEKPFRTYDWARDRHHLHAAEEIKELCRWWLNIALPRRGRGLRRKSYKLAQKEEEAWDREVLRQLIRLMKIRKFLWT